LTSPVYALYTGLLHYCKVFFDITALPQCRKP